MRAAAFFVLSVLTAAVASAQSLADVARQEGERRQTTPAATRSYSNKDLKPVPMAPADDKDKANAPAPAAGSDPSADSTASDAGTSADAAESTEKSDSKTSDVKDEKYWSKRMAELRAQLERDETFMQALQSRVDALTTDFVNRDDPAQRGQIANDRQKAVAELERLRKAIEVDKRAIPDLEEEARRSGVPAGWLR